MGIEDLLEQLEAAKKRGDLNNQIEIVRQILSLNQQYRNAPGEIETLRWLGNLYQEKDEPQKAHSYRLMAAKLAEDPGLNCPPEGRMAVEGDLGRSFVEFKEWDRAEQHTQRALEIAESLHDERAQCIFKMNLGIVYFGTERRKEASRLGEEVLSVAERLKDHYVLGLQHANLASFLIHEARINDSQYHARQAIAHAELSENKALLMQAQMVLGESFRYGHLLTGRREYSADAERHLRQSLESAQKRGNPSVEADTEIKLAQLCEDRRQFSEAVDHYRRALESLEKVRSNIGYEEFQLTYFRSLESNYNSIIEFLLRQGQADQAFLTGERLRSRSLLALLGQGRSNITSWSTSQQNELKEILNRYGDEVRSGSFPLTKARKSFLQLYESQRLYQTNWRAQQSPSVAGFEAEQRLLSPDEALLSYYVTDRSIIIFVATDDERHFQHLAYPREKIEDDVQESRLAMIEMKDQISVERSLEKLYALLVAPVLAVVDQKYHWIIIPHGPLHGLPWAALRGKGRYLVEDHSISLLPSASVGAALRSYESPAVGEAVFFADPDLTLPGAQKEVREIYKSFQEGPPPFIGVDATKGEFLSHAANTRLLHFACHHSFDANASLLSFLKLAGSAGADYLYAFEVADLDLSAAELVSLSACKSGLSRIATGDEQIGIVRSFLVAGAHSVISTLWGIEDESAAALFINFYEVACEFPLGQALAIAQRRLLSDPRYELPYFWAPYILSGQWNKGLTFER